jgi:acyl-CoA synthetase (AMP-forming)/AMP-acid ligase II
VRWIDYVAKVVERYPDTLAVICHGEQLTYAQLWEAVGKEALRLRDIEHIQEGQYYVQACTQDIAYVVRFLALHLIGARCDILYTTGSTGKPKAVLLSDEGMIANGENLIDAMGFHHGLDLCDMRPLGPFRTLEQDASRIYDRRHAAYS